MSSTVSTNTPAKRIRYRITLSENRNATDKRVNAKINIAKQDAETGNAAQGDATLEGAVYGLYAREDIVHPDGRTGTIHKKDRHWSLQSVQALVSGA